MSALRNEGKVVAFPILDGMCPCRFDSSVPSRRLAAWADELILSGVCSHVQRVELLPHDGVFYAVLDAICFDPSRNLPRCSKPSSNQLVMLALRPPSRGKQTLKGTVTVEAMPLDALHIEGARAHQGAHRLDQKSFVLFPSGGVLSEWRKDSKIEFLPIEKAVPASIDFYLAIKRDGPKATSASLALPVVVPPVPREDPTLPLELTALVLAEGVKLLVRDGWDFVKGQISRVTGKEPDIIQLHIGDLTLGPETATDDAIDQATKSVSVSVSNASVEEVSGLNRRLQTLFIRKKHLLSNVDRAATTIDKSNALAEIDHTDRDIKEVKDKLWLALEAAGVLSVSGQA